MARNEEKQLARLNRYYLQQQKEEELKKRPPRPRLDTLTTVDDVKTWLPSILRDIDFYVKQMEVPCYPKRQIEEFEKRIDQLRGEYKAFIRKLRQLEPDLESTPWSDRPYTGKRKKTVAGQVLSEQKDTAATDDEELRNNRINQSDPLVSKNFVPIATPVLRNDSFYLHCYGYEKHKEPEVDDTDLLMQDRPLQFGAHCKSLEYTRGLDNEFDFATHRSLHNDAPLDFDWQRNKSAEVEKHYGQDKCKIFQDIVSAADKDYNQEPEAENSCVCSEGNTVIHQSQCVLTSVSVTDNKQKMCDLHINIHTCVDGDGSHRKEICKSQSEARDSGNITVSSTIPQDSNVKVQGGLNLPYTDSSSSDEET